MRAIYILALFITTQLNAAQHTNEQQLEIKAKQITKKFATELKENLQSAIKNGGLIAGVRICNSKAPEIAKSYSIAGWEIGRTSLKTRNTANKPTDKEGIILEDFAKKQLAGQDIASLSYSNYNTKTKQYHFMKAIPTNQICLACHGENIASELSNEIDKLYPSDLAKGYKLGDLRGAFSLTYKKSE